MLSRIPDDDHREDDVSSDSSPSQVAEVVVETLFGEAKEIVLIYQGERYHLRRTRRGRLVLTK